MVKTSSTSRAPLAREFLRVTKCVGFIKFKKENIPQEETKRR